MVSPRTPLLRDAVENYLERMADEQAAPTVRTKRDALLRLCRYLPEKQVGRLTTDDLDGFLRAMYRGDRKVDAFKASNGTTIRTYRAHLSAFVTWAARKGWVKASIMDDVFLPKPEPRRDFLYLSAAEMLAMLDDAEPRDRILLATAINTGLRSAEVKRLRLTDFDLDQSRFFVKVTKNNTTDSFPINSDYRAEIDRWLDYYRSEVGELKASYYMVPARHRPDISKRTEVTYGPLNPTAPVSEPARHVKAAFLRAGYSRERIAHEGMHTFRRSVARLYFDAACEKGYDAALRETAAFLHHKRTTTTELYLGLSAETEARDRRLMDRPFLTGMVGNSHKVVRSA